MTMASLLSIRRCFLRLELSPISSMCGFHTSSTAQKVKVNLTPQMAAKKKRKLDKILSRHERFGGRILKPIDEKEVSVHLKRDIRAGTRTREKVVYSSEELEAQILLMKDWTRYRMKFHNMEMKACFKMKAAEQKALDKLREESEELYQQAIQCDDKLLPYTFKGPLNTPPKTDYDAADGHYIDRTNYFTVDTGLFYDESLFKSSRKKR